MDTTPTNEIRVYQILDHKLDMLQERIGKINKLNAKRLSWGNANIQMWLNMAINRIEYGPDVKIIG